MCLKKIQLSVFVYEDMWVMKPKKKNTIQVNTRIIVQSPIIWLWLTLTLTNWKRNWWQSIYKPVATLVVACSSLPHLKVFLETVQVSIKLPNMTKTNPLKIQLLGLPSPNNWLWSLSLLPTKAKIETQIQLQWSWWIFISP